MGAWTRKDIEALGPLTDVPTTAAMIGVCADTIYASIRRGDWTMTRVLRLGRKIKIPTFDIIRVLYAPETDSSLVSAQTPPVPSQCHHSEKAQVTHTTPQSQCGCNSGESAVIRPLRGA